MCVNARVIAHVASGDGAPSQWVRFNAIESLVVIREKFGPSNQKSCVVMIADTK